MPTRNVIIGRVSAISLAFSFIALQSSINPTKASTAHITTIALFIFLFTLQEAQKRTHPPKGRTETFLYRSLFSYYTYNTSMDLGRSSLF